MKFSLAAVAIALGGLAIPAAAQQALPQQAEAASQPQPSPKAQAAILALQTAVKAHDTANIPGKLAAAQAVASTPADHYWIAHLQLEAAVADNNFPAAQQSLDAISASNVLPASQMADLYAGLGGTYLKAKQYDQAVSAYEKASSLAPTDANNALLIAQARSDQGRKADAAAAMQRALQISKAAGQKPSEDIYRNAVALAYESNLPGSIGLARDWLTAYPSDEAWRNSVAIYRNVNHGDPDNIIDVMRLARLTNAMQTDTDYKIYASKAVDQGNFAEAKAAIDAGIAAGKLKATNRDIAQYIAATKGKVPTAAELAAAEKGAIAPNAFLRVGDRYYAAGDYTKATALYRQALAKGVDSNLANLRIGEALLRAGDKVGATAAFNAVGASRSDLGKFWLLYLQTHG